MKEIYLNYSLKDMTKKNTQYIYIYDIASKFANKFMFFINNQT